MYVIDVLVDQIVQNNIEINGEVQKPFKTIQIWRTNVKETCIEIGLILWQNEFLECRDDANTSFNASTIVEDHK